jgi:hypothetical protein
MTLVAASVAHQLMKLAGLKIPVPIYISMLTERHSNKGIEACLALFQELRQQAAASNSFVHYNLYRWVFNVHTHYSILCGPRCD